MLPILCSLAFESHLPLVLLLLFPFHVMQIMQLLMKGNKERTQEPTAANKTSSRSHAVLQVTVKQASRLKALNEEVRLGRLFMVDLAGSERAAQVIVWLFPVHSLPCPLLPRPSGSLALHRNLPPSLEAGIRSFKTKV